MKTTNNNWKITLTIIKITTLPWTNQTQLDNLVPQWTLNQLMLPYIMKGHHNQPYLTVPCPYQCSVTKSKTFRKLIVQDRRTPWRYQPKNHPQTVRVLEQLHYQTSGQSTLSTNRTWTTLLILSGKFKTAGKRWYSPNVRFSYRVSETLQSTRKILSAS